MDWQQIGQNQLLDQPAKISIQSRFEASNETDLIAILRYWKRDRKSSKVHFRQLRYYGIENAIENPQKYIFVKEVRQKKEKKKKQTMASLDLEKI